MYSAVGTMPTYEEYFLDANVIRQDEDLEATSFNDTIYAEIIAELDAGNMPTMPTGLIFLYEWLSVWFARHKCRAVNCQLTTINVVYLIIRTVLIDMLIVKNNDFG